MKALLIFFVLACTAPCFGAASIVSSVPHRYTPISHGTDAKLGDMTLSSSSARFSLLRGRMRLRFAGRAEDPEGLGLGLADIYKIENAASFFQSNRGANGFCNEPIQWMGVVPLRMERNSIRIFFYGVSNYREYRPDKPGLCSADSYVLAR